MPFGARRRRHRRGREHLDLRRLRPRHQEERLVLDREVRHPLHDRVRRVGDRVGNVRFERVIHFAVLLRPADDGREVLGLGPAQRVVDADQAAAAAQIRVERRAILHAHVAGVPLVDDHHVDVGELLGRGEVEAAVDDRVAVHEQLAPVRQELGIVVLPFGVRLQPRVDVHAHGRGLKRIPLRLLRGCRRAEHGCGHEQRDASPHERSPSAVIASYTSC